MSELLTQAGTIVSHLRPGNNQETFICLDYYHRRGLKYHISDLKNNQEIFIYLDYYHRRGLKYHISDLKNNQETFICQNY